MANFNISHEIVMDIEGGYSCDPIDIGGETYKGISRKYNPDWKGWEIIDEYKNQPNFPNNINSSILVMHERSLYKEKYWDRFKGDHIQDQEIANELYDISVNMGLKRAVEFLQKAINVLNRNQKDYPNISEDGIMGSDTLNVLNNNPKNFGHIFNILNILQGYHYIKNMKDNETQERFARGWLSRVEIRRT